MEDSLISILFVDDEPNILNGLKRMLHSMSKSWSMEFCLSGQEALNLMQKQTFDVVISDMRMPEMDGAQLLTKIKETYPQIVCIILSGYSDKEMILRTIGPADCFLSKPCSAEIIKSTINKLIAFRSTLSTQPQTFANLLQTKNLLLLPTIYNEWLELLGDEKVKLDDLFPLIIHDPIMTAKILQLVNSSFFGIGRNITDPKLALTLLGIDNLRIVVLMTSIFNQFTKEQVDKFAIKEIYAHSVAVSQIAAQIAESIAIESKIICHIAGLLHDLGKLILIKNIPDQYEEIITKSLKENIPLYMVEQENLAISHAQLGAFLLCNWQIDSNIVAAVREHHDTINIGNSLISTIVHTANELYYEAKTVKTDKAIDFIDWSYLEKLNLTSWLPKWREITKTIMGEKNDSKYFI